jgi:uncharacterized protein (DUF1499 family)
MTFIKWLLVLIVVLALAAVIAGQLGVLQGTAPSDIGVRDGKLKAPADTPNSVSSQTALHPGHPMRGYADIAPLPLSGDAAATLARIQSIVESMPGAKVVRSEPGYLYVQFTTRLMKYVDDTEFWFDAKAHVVQVRSASRVGRKDFAANRERIEAIRIRLAAAP